MALEAMNFVVRQGFYCPDCNVPVVFRCSGYRDNGHIYLIGECEKCKDGIALDIVDIVKSIMKAASKRVN